MLTNFTKTLGLKVDGHAAVARLLAVECIQAFSASDTLAQHRQ